MKREQTSEESWAAGNMTRDPIRLKIVNTTGSNETGNTNGLSANAKNILTASRIQTFKRCPREEKISYQDGYRATSDAEALRFGALVHLGLEAWWKADHPDNRLHAAFVAMVEDLPRDSDPFVRTRAEVMMRAYDARWGAEDFEVLAVEHEFQIPLVNPDTGAASKTWVLGGKIDAIVRDKNGDVWIVEHKTSSLEIGAGSDYVARLILDGQVSMYIEAARALGFNPRGVIYDILRKPQLRPLEVNTRRAVAETPDEHGVRIAEAIVKEPDKYFQRATVVRLESEVIEFQRELWQLAATMRDAARQGIAYKNPDSCMRYGAKCPYWPVCSGQASLDDESMFKRLEWVHSELTE